MKDSTMLETLVRRHYTSGLSEGQSVYDLFKWRRVDVTIPGKPGKPPVFHMTGVEVPEEWSNNAAQIAASKYFRKAGVTGTTDGMERSMRQVAHRLALAWCTHGVRNGYLTNENAKIFYDEIVYMILAQVAAPNSPQWFNTGLFEAYGIAGAKTGAHWVPDHKTGAVTVAEDSYSRPQVMACFIQSVEDSMLEPGGIYDLVKSEAALFKFGSGTGSNFSNLRAKDEKLSGGGRSSGLLSWLRILDTSAGAIKSGGTVRRAAKMVILDVDHPDIEEFVTLKAREELKVRAMAYGATMWSDEDKEFAKRTGLHLDTNFNGEGYETVNGQNANFSVRLSDDFMRAVKRNDQWNLINRVDRSVAKTISARSLWDKIAESAWRCADPGVQFDTTIQTWHTCPASGRINATNPCSEYVHLDNTACNLASLNLVKFTNADGGFDVYSYRHAIHLWTMVLEISVSMASYPTAEIAKRSWEHRPLGLGYANLGALLMRSGFAYDSEQGRRVAAALTAILTGEAYLTSAYLAQQQGPFAAFEANRDAMLKVIDKHLGYAEMLSGTGPSLCREALQSWRDAQAAGSAFGFRNSQATVIAPTGTIAFVMDCDTTGIEPDFSLVKYKELAGGGHMKIVNQSVGLGLLTLGYDPSSIQNIVAHVEERGTVVGCTALKSEHAAVFACAVGDDAIQPNGHLSMMAVCQPFLSGAISKTVNLPNSATIDTVQKVYLDAWESGLKCVALYRDGCKMSQPLNTKSETSRATTNDALHERPDTTRKPRTEPAVTPVRARRKLPDNCAAKRHKFSVGEFEGYVHVGMYNDGTPGEIFIRMTKQGSTIGGLLDAFATCASMALQYGVPIEDFVKKFAFQKFEPCGITSEKDIPFAQSIVDYIARWMGMEFIEGFREAHAPSRAVHIEQPVAAVEVPVEASQTAVARARTMLNTPGNDVPCALCGNTMQRSGTCLTCPSCGTNTGCGG